MTVQNRVLLWLCGCRLSCGFPVEMDSRLIAQPLSRSPPTSVPLSLSRSLPLPPSFPPHPALSAGGDGPLEPGRIQDRVGHSPKRALFLSVPPSVPPSLRPSPSPSAPRVVTGGRGGGRETNRHTHTHTHIYIYRERERGREGEIERGSERER